MKVSYLAFESSMARAERHIRRLTMALIVAVAALGVSNLAWLVATMIR